jgi:glucokinase
MSRGLDSQPLLLGIDIGGTNIKWALVAGSQLMQSGAVPTSRDGERAVAGQVAELIDKFDAEIQGVGVTFPGHVDLSTGCTGIVVNLPGDWNGFPLRSVLAEATGRTVGLLNDARAFALAELGVGAAGDLTDVVFVAIGTGVGGAIALDGVLLGGPAGRAGEIGHVCVDPGGRACACGGRGCLDGVAGGAGLVAAAAPLLADGASGAEPATPAAVFAAAAAGHAGAAGVVERATVALGDGVASACALLGIPNVVIGGGLAALYPDLTSRIHQRLTAIHPLIGEPHVRLASLNDHAAAIGAALGAQLTHRERS